jgi:alpha-tubulin suppressor-like RCC1 family protein
MFGQSSPPDGSFARISAGGLHTCGLRADNSITCWGDSDFGQLDAPEDSFTQMSAGYHHTCGVRVDGSLACWGRNDDGQAAPPDGSFAQVSAGRQHTCGLRTDGSTALHMPSRATARNTAGAVPIVHRFSPSQASFREKPRMTVYQE